MHEQTMRYIRLYVPFKTRYTNRRALCYCKWDHFTMFICLFFWFVAYTIIQSITQQWNLCSAFNLEQWAADAAATRRAVWRFGALHKGLTSVVDNSCRSRDSNPQPRITSPTLSIRPRLPQSSNRLICRDPLILWSKESSTAFIWNRILFCSNVKYLKSTFEW